MDIITHIISKKDKIIFILIIVWASLIGYNRVYKQNLIKMDSIKAKIEDEKKRSDLLGMIGVLERKSQKYKDRLFPVAEITPVLDRISELVKKTGVEAENYNPLPPESKDYYVEVPIKVPLRCQYHDLGRFLSLIESNQEFIWIKELHMQKSTVIEPGETIIPKIDLTLSGICLKK